MNRASAAAWYGLMGLALLASPAWAARKTTVAVVGAHLPGLDAEAAEATRLALEEALDASDRLDAIDGESVRNGLAGREVLVLEGAFLAPGRARLQEGRVLYERAEFEAAVPVLEGSVEALEDASLRTRDIRDLLDSLLLLGLARFSLGDEEGAKAAWSRLVVLDPARQLDAVNYPPKVVSRFQAIREEVKAKTPASLQLNVQEDAQIFVDGIAVTARSLSLPPGSHFVLAQSADGRQEAAVVSLQAGQKGSFSPSQMSRQLAPPSAAAEEKRNQCTLLYRSLGEHSGANLLLLAGQVGDGPAARVSLQLYEPRTGNFSRQVDAEAGEDPTGALVDLVPAIAAMVDESGALRADRVAKNALALDLTTNAWLTSALLEPRPVSAGGEEKKTPWLLWAGVGAIATGGAVGLAFALQPDPETGKDGGNGAGDGAEPEPVNPHQGTIIFEIP